MAYRIARKRRVGNWSGTGAGKTLSAILATRVVSADFTVICCPNTVVTGWKDSILETFPQAVVLTKAFVPNWHGEVSDLAGFGRELDGQPRYLVLNYEAFQQPSSPENVQRLADGPKIDFIVVDEIHFTKQRCADDLTLRKQNVQALIALAEAKNPDLCVLGMSATPVINNLQEGKSLVELITSTRQDDQKTRPTVQNCMSLHQRLVRLGTRWMPRYEAVCEEITPTVDCSEHLPEIRLLGSEGTPLRLEQILTRARLPLILEALRPKTVIYTHYIQGIDRILWDAVTSTGWRVGFFTGLYLQMVKQRDEHGHFAGTKLKAVFGSLEEVTQLLGEATAYIERSNLTSRLFNGRQVRKTLAFSKDADCYRAAATWEDMYYNLVKPHKSLRLQVLNVPGRKWKQRTPMMAAKLTR